MSARELPTVDEVVEPPQVSTSWMDDQVRTGAVRIEMLPRVETPQPIDCNPVNFFIEPRTLFAHAAGMGASLKP